MNDWDYVNFSEEYELNYQLEKVNKRQTQSNRAVLVVMGNELKKLKGKIRLLHEEFNNYILDHLNRLD